jgi:uncharacterized membrane protein YhaH (DUF805 family)
VDFQTAVKTVFLQKYADFSGRSRRSEFWFGYLAYVVAAVVVNVIARVIGLQFLSFVLVLAAIVPLWASGARRLHDTGRSGWWLFISFTLIGCIPLIVWFAEDGKPEVNEHGPSPKAGLGYNQDPNYNPNQGQDPNWGQPQG